MKKPQSALSVGNRPVTSIPITDEIQAVFKAVSQECVRSSTRKDLHSDPMKDNVLALLLRNVIETFGINITAAFEKENIRLQPELTYLYAQVTNAVLEKTFHDGSCHAQAAYAVIEFAKKFIFNVSLTKSETGNELGDHYYLMILEEHTSQFFLKVPGLFLRATENRLNPESIFFDTWSSQLCRWKEFKEKDSYTDKLRKTPQVLIKPFDRLFKDPAIIFQKILWCLDQFEKDLKALKLPEKFPFAISLESEDNAYLDEVKLLLSPEACREKVLSVLAGYKVELTMVALKAKLLKSTTAFTKTSFWKTYPAAQLAKTKFDGHNVKYFTIPDAKAINPTAFFSHLQKEGFSVEMKYAKDKPSIIVDLSTSTLEKNDSNSITM